MREALHDLEAALQWAKSSGQTGPIMVWGSSYSAALVFLLAASHRRGEVKAILAFSPGEYLHGSSTVRKAAAQVSIPIFVTSAKDQKRLQWLNPFSMSHPRPKKANSSRRSQASMDLRRSKRPEPRWSRRKLGGGQTISREILPLEIKGVSAASAVPCWPRIEQEGRPTRVSLLAASSALKPDGGMQNIKEGSIATELRFQWPHPDPCS